MEIIRYWPRNSQTKEYFYIFGCIPHNEVPGTDSMPISAPKLQNPVRLIFRKNELRTFFGILEDLHGLNGP